MTTRDDYVSRLVDDVLQRHHHDRGLRSLLRSALAEAYDAGRSARVAELEERVEWLEYGARGWPPPGQVVVASKRAEETHGRAWWLEGTDGE